MSQKHPQYRWCTTPSNLSIIPLVTSTAAEPIYRAIAHVNNDPKAPPVAFRELSTKFVNNGNFISSNSNGSIRTFAIVATLVGNQLDRTSGHYNISSENYDINLSDLKRAKARFTLLQLPLEESITDEERDIANVARENYQRCASQLLFFWTAKTNVNPSHGFYWGWNSPNSPASVFDHMVHTEPLFRNVPTETSISLANIEKYGSLQAYQNSPEAANERIAKYEPQRDQPPPDDGRYKLAQLDDPQNKLHDLATMFDLTEVELNLPNFFDAESVRINPVNYSVVLEPGTPVFVEFTCKVITKPRAIGHATVKRLVVLPTTEQQLTTFLQNHFAQSQSPASTPRKRATTSISSPAAAGPSSMLAAPRAASVSPTKKTKAE
ncbi:hypothetical protein D9758_001712 [Tetrapyrgos nigripes]|uniref:Uncharacterized protein n=1 Tax=Tetrapyrgos nigripes TaxID=182062 RepID=A0A8H5LWS0_9AGAR|nr:hypothetical protein D9758_001712 [Tetrapyrgos nigripes]